MDDTQQSARLQEALTRVSSVRGWVGRTRGRLLRAPRSASLASAYQNSARASRTPSFLPSRWRPRGAALGESPVEPGARGAADLPAWRRSLPVRSPAAPT